jgi:hypothetical protein
MGALVMSVMRIIGIVLVALGIIALVSGSLTYTKDKDRVDVGPVGIEVKDEETVRIPPALSAVAVIGGVILLFAGRKRIA